MTDLARRLALAGALLLLASPAPAFPQDPPKDPAPPTEEEKKKAEEEKKKAEAEKKTDEVKTFLENYEANLAKMTDEDAIAGLGKMKAWYLEKDMPEEAKKAIFKTFGTKVIRAKKEPYLEAAAKALGDMGDDAAVPMLQYIVDAAMKPKVPVFSVSRAGLLAMGKLASTKPSDMKFITDLLKKKDEFIADAARALAGYEKAPGTVRRDLVDELVGISGSVWRSSEANDSNAKKKWNTWGSDVLEAIEKLSRKKLANPDDYEKWMRNKDPGGGKHPKTWEDPPKEEKPKNGK